MHGCIGGGSRYCMDGPYNRRVESSSQRGVDRASRGGGAFLLEDAPNNRGIQRAFRSRVTSAFHRRVAGAHRGDSWASHRRVEERSCEGYGTSHPLAGDASPPRGLPVTSRDRSPHISSGAAIGSRVVAEDDVSPASLLSLPRSYSPWTAITSETAGRACVSLHHHGQPRPVELQLSILETTTIGARTLATARRRHARTIVASSRPEALRAMCGGVDLCTLSVQPHLASGRWMVGSRFQAFCLWMLCIALGRRVLLSGVGSSQIYRRVMIPSSYLR